MQVCEYAPDIEDTAIEMVKDLGENLVDLTNAANEYLDVKHKTYTRELFIPAGTVLIGKAHKKACVNIITKGKLIIKATAEDEGMEIYVPHHQSRIFTSEAGKRKLIYTIEDTIFINVFSNVEAKTLAEVEAELVIPSTKFNDFIKGE